MGSGSVGWSSLGEGLICSEPQFPLLEKEEKRTDLAMLLCDLKETTSIKQSASNKWLSL